MQKLLTIFLLVNSSTNVFLDQVPVNETNDADMRRVYYGDAIKKFTDPYSSAVTIRNAKDLETHICSGVLVSRQKVFTVSTCVRPDEQYFVGYGSVNADEHHLILVENIKMISLVDAALLTLVSEVLLPDTNDFRVYDKSRWFNGDFHDNPVQRKTFLIGYGDYQGSPVDNEPMLSNELRQENYAFSGNMKYCEIKNYPGAGIGPAGLKIDHRYMCSASKAEPIDGGDTSRWTTACTADRGGPVFYKDNDNLFKLAGIHSTGPKKCGQGAFIESALLMFALKDENI